MKRNQNFKQLLSLFTLLVFFMNLFTPKAVFASENAKSGNTITLSIERRVLGESDIFKSTTEKINPGEKASISIDKILKNLNIEYENTGSLDKNFYISAIKTPEGEFLSEFDHGSYSGWKYSVNGVYPNVGLSDYEFKNGDKVRIQYTAKDMGQDILVVDTIYQIRDELAKAEKISKDKYTEESFNNLQSEISKVKTEIPNDTQIGKMMSSTLGEGNCDTVTYGTKMTNLLKGLEGAMGNLVEKPAKPEIPNITPSFDIDMFSNWDQPNPNTVYLQEGQKSIGARLIRLSGKYKPVMYDGKELDIIDGYAYMEIKPGIHKLSIKRWGRPYEITFNCKNLPYTVEGDATPGGTVTINFNGGVEEGVKEGKYKLKETRLEFNTNIPGLKTVSSETLNGSPVDRNKLSKVTFTIPKDTNPGEYELTNGGIYQTWGGLSYGRDEFKGKFSEFPTIKLTVNPKIDLSKAYDLDLSNWSDFDKVFSLEDNILLKLKGIDASSKVLVNGEAVNPVGGIYAVKLPIGDNKINVDGKDYKVTCEKVSYSISNTNEITPGSTVKVQFTGLKKAFIYIPGKYNPYVVKTVYETNIPGLETVESKGAGSFTQIDDNVLNQVTFKVPKDAKPGMYELSNGAIYQEWYGQPIYNNNNRKFSLLPKVNFQVKDSIHEDKEAPQISSDLNDNAIVSKGKLKFRVIVTDNVDSAIKPMVKLNGEEVTGINVDEYTVDLNEGENKIEIDAVDSAGNKSTKTYTINYKVNLRPGASIILDTLDLVLNNGQTHQLISVDSPDKRVNSDDETARMIYTVTSGNDVVKVSKLGLVTALKPGFAEISVRYPGLTSPAIVHVHVKGENESNGPKVTTSITETKYDTLYYSGNSYDYSFSVESPDSHVTVMFNNKEISKDSNGKYNVALTEGYNHIKITATKGSKITYETYNLKAKKAKVSIENVTNPGKPLIQGDKVKISFNGLETPVPKFLRVYNPKRTRVEYKTDMPGATNIYGTPTQYDLATNNAIEFTASSAGTFNFTGGNIEEAWWGDKLFSERDITGEDPNTSAPVRQGNFSKLPSFTLEVKENKNYKNNYSAEILNKEPIKAGDEVTLKINNLGMPNPNAGRVIKANTLFNTDIPRLGEIKSEDAASDAKKLQTIKFKVPDGTKAGTYTLTNGRVFKQWEPGVLWVDSEFYKGELPVVKLVITGDTEKPEPPVIDTEKPEPPIVDNDEPVDVVKPIMTVDEGINHAIKWTVENVKNPTFGNEWDILGLVRSGLFNDKEYLNTYYNNLVNVVKEKKGNLTRNKYTEYSRTILALTSIGKDPKNVGGYNLVEKLYDYNKVSKQGINGVIFALIALDSNNYEIPKDANNSREKMLRAILDAQLKDGGFALSGNVGNVDVTGMAIQALAKYKNQVEVKASIDKALDFLSDAQLSDGGFASDGVKNVEASVQVLVGLTSLGVDSKSDKFVKEDNWMVSDIMNFAVENGGYKHSLDQSHANDIATEQTLYGLSAYRRYLNKNTPLYDMSDVVLDNDNNGVNNGDRNDGNSENENNGGNDNSGIVVKPDSNINSGNYGSEEVVKPDVNYDSLNTNNESSLNNNENKNKPSTDNNGLENTIKPNRDNQLLLNNIGLDNNLSSSNNWSVAQGKNSNTSNSSKAENKVDKTEKQDVSATSDEANKDDSLKVDKSDVNKIKTGDDNTDLVNGTVNSQKQPLSNIQVVFLTLAVVFVLLALKEVAVRQYRKKKEK